MDTMTDTKALEQRRRYVTAFNDTMIRIWRERITLLGVIDSGALYRSVTPTHLTINPDATIISAGQRFRTYGIYVNYGTGRDTPRGNPGDIRRPKIRRPRQWFDRKYYASVMNLRDFLAENLSLQTVSVISAALLR